MGLEGLFLALGAMSIGSSLAEGKAQQQAHEYNAAIYQQQAQLAKQQGDVQRLQLDREKVRTRKRQEVLYAKAGVQLTGSPLEVINDTASQFLFDDMIIGYNAQMGAARSRASAEYSRNLGNAAYEEGLWKAGTTLLTTAVGYGMNFAEPEE